MHQKLNISICYSDCTANATVIGDGFCNDETNNADCNYDGGDCCGSCVVTDHCSQCGCIGGANKTNILIANGFCNDETNTADCNYDGGDCCGYTATARATTTPSPSGCGSPDYANDKWCDDENNNPSCNFDGGACCDNNNSGWDSYCTVIYIHDFSINNPFLTYFVIFVEM